MFFSAHIMSHLNYVSNVWDGSAEVHMKLLQSLHRRAIKMLKYESFCETENIYKKKNILPLTKQLLYNKNVLMFRTLHGKTPPYLFDFITFSVRSASSQRMRLPKPRIDLYKSSFAFSGSAAWNSLPYYIKASTSLASFKKNLQKYLMSTV